MSGEPVWRAEVRGALGRLARKDRNRVAVTDARGDLTFGRLFKDALDGARAIDARAGTFPGGYRMLAARSDRRFISAVFATLLSGRTALVVSERAAAEVPDLLGTPQTGCRPWKAMLGVADAEACVMATCGGPGPAHPDKALALGMREHGRALITSPLHLPDPLECALRQILLGGTALLGAPFDPDRWLAHCTGLTPDWALTTPTQIRALLAGDPRRLRAATQGLRTLICAGESCPPPLRAALLDVLPADRVALYYGTALFDGALATGRALSMATVAMTPIRGAALRIVDAGAQPLPPGRLGRIQGLAHTHPTTAPCPEPGTWAGTGERGYLARDGALFVADTDVPGRAVIAGSEVSLRRVAQLLKRHPAVTAASVSAAGDPERGYALAAQVFTRDPALSAEDLSGWCHARLDPAERPAHLTVTLQRPEASR